MNTATNNTTITVYSRRWYILIVYSINAVLLSLGMLVYQAVPQVVFDTYTEADLDDADLNRILSIGSLSFLVFLLLTFIVDGITSSLRIMTITSTIALVIQCVLRLLPHWIPSLKQHAIIFILLSQLFNQLGCAFSYPLPTRVSATWFPASERGFVTGLASQANVGGCALSFLIVPLVAQTPEEFETMLYIILAMQSLCAIAILVYFPAAPPTPPSFSELAKQSSEVTYQAGSVNGANPPPLEIPPPQSKSTFFARLQKLIQPIVEMFRLLGNLRFLYLIVVATLHAGAMPSWGANLPLLFSELGLSTTAAGLVSFGHLAACVVGALFMSFFYHRWVNNSARIVYFLEFSITVLFLLAIFPLFPFAPREDSKPFWDAPWLAAVFSILLGFIAQAATPFFYECTAEMTYPAPDVLSGGLMTAATSIGYFIFPMIFSFVGIGWIHLVTLCSELLVVFLALFVRVNPQRTTVEEGAARNPTPSLDEPLTSA